MRPTYLTYFLNVGKVKGPRGIPTVQAAFARCVSELIDTAREREARVVLTAPRFRFSAPLYKYTHPEEMHCRDTFGNERKPKFPGAMCPLCKNDRVERIQLTTHRAQRNAVHVELRVL